MTERRFCNECAGPYPLDSWPGEQYGGHWDTCPNRTTTAERISAQQEEHHTMTDRIQVTKSAGSVVLPENFADDQDRSNALAEMTPDEFRSWASSLSLAEVRDNLDQFRLIEREHKRRAERTATMARQLRGETREAAAHNDPETESVAQDTMHRVMRG